MGGVTDGQPVNAAITNAAFIEKNADDQMPHKLDFTDTDPVSGAAVTNIQRNINAIASYLGASLNQVFNYLPTWATTNRGLSNNSVFQRVEAIDTAFDPSTGHDHSGTSGNGPKISATNLGSLPLRGRLYAGGPFQAVPSGSPFSSVDCSTFLSGVAVSTGSTVEGIVTNNPENIVLLRNHSSGGWQQPFLDANGNQIYGRITNSGGPSGTWTITYKVTDLTSTESTYTFSGGQNIDHYFQYLYKQISNSPVVYNPMFDFAQYMQVNYTHSVITATTSLLGLTELSNSTPAAVSSSGSAGTANGTVANADHVHAGVTSVAASGYTAIQGAVTLQAGTNVTLGQTGNTITINSTSGGAASNPYNPVTKTANYTIAAGDYVEADFSGGSFTLTLPAASSCSGVSFPICVTGASPGGVLTIKTTGSDKINGDSTLTLTDLYASVLLISNGSNAFRIF